MAITMLCSADTPGAELNEYWTKQVGRDIFLRTFAEGLVVSTSERNGYDDSDFFAEVWNEEKGDTESILYASTRGWTYPNNAVIDATPEVLQKLAAVKEKRRAAREAAIAEVKAMTPDIGKQVEIVGGSNKGATGRVFWFGKAKKFGRSYAPPPFGWTLEGVIYGMRCGVDTGAEKVFVDAKFAKVVSE
jgi:hypothetical protein